MFLVWPGNVNSSFWALFALTTTVYVVMYFLMYAAVIKLRYSQPNTVRRFKIPGGIVGVWILAGAPAASACLTRPLPNEREGIAL